MNDIKSLIAALALAGLAACADNSPETFSRASSPTLR